MNLPAPTCNGAIGCTMRPFESSGTPRAPAGTGLVLLCIAGVVWFLDQAAAGEAGASAIVWGAITLGASALLRRQLDGPDDMVTTAGVVYALSALVGAFVVWDNHSNTGLHFSTNFDDSFYYVNAVELARGRVAQLTQWTLFEVLLALWCSALEPFKAIAPVDLLPVNWSLTALCVTMSAELARRVSGRPVPRPWLLAVTLGQYQLLAVVPFLYRDMLVAVSFVGAALFAWVGAPWRALPFIILATGTRGGHGVLAAFTAASLHFTSTATFQRAPRTMTAVGVVLLAAAVAVGANLSAGFLSGRVGEEASGNVATFAVERQQRWTENYAQTGSSFGERVLGLGPVGFPLRMVSGYFAPVVFRDATYEKSFNSLFLPGSMGDRYRVRGTFRFTYAEWVSILLWPLTAPLLLLGMRRLARGDTRQRTLLGALALAFFLIMVVSMQERHRVPILAFNPVFIAMALAQRSSAAEARFVALTRSIVVAGIVALNITAVLQRALGS